MSRMKKEEARRAVLSECGLRSTARSGIPVLTHGRESMPNEGGLLRKLGIANGQSRFMKVTFLSLKISPYNFPAAYCPTVSPDRRRPRLTYAFAGGAAFAHVFDLAQKLLFAVPFICR